jgi:hypothetical protein
MLSKKKEQEKLGVMLFFIIYATAYIIKNFWSMDKLHTSL